MKVKEEHEKAGLKLSVQKTKIMVSVPITSWQIDGEKVEAVTDFIFLGSEITVEIKPEYSLEGLILKLQYYGHLMQRADSLEKTVMLRKIEGKKRKGQWRMRWLGSITDSMDVNLSKLREIVGEGNGTPVQHSCLENPMDGGAVHGVAKSRSRLSHFTFTFHLHALEKEMATHCSILAWRIPGTGEPGGLPSMGPHRVRHD